MLPRSRNRLGLILLLLMFAAPFLLAWALSAFDWRPQGTRNYGELVAPPQDLGNAHFVLADGSSLPWKDRDWSWTLVALAGPDCAANCLARLDELRRVRITMNQNEHRVRVIVLGTQLSPAQLDRLKPLQLARDADAALASLRPGAADTVAVALVDPHGFFVLRYAVGYDANGMRKDLTKLIKG